MKIGDQFWAISPSSESQANGGGWPVRPWLGKVAKIYDPAVLLCRFDAETGEPDEDSNASVGLNPAQLYATERDAWSAYLAELEALTRQWDGEIAAAQHWLAGSGNGPAVAAGPAEAPGRPGYDRLWLWFSISRAGWVTLPRVLLHEMPDDWQGRLAALLEEYEETFSEWPADLGCRVQLTSGGHLTSLYNWLHKYRHPALGKIANLRATRPAPPAP